MKDFGSEIQKIYNQLKNNHPLAVARFGDGEMFIFQNKNLDLTNKNTGEFKFNANDKQDQKYRQHLIDSLRYKHPNYKSGIGCRCCVGQQNFLWTKNFSQKTDPELTWANIFVNGNYKFFEKQFINNEFNKHKIVLICNKNATIDKLPFRIHKRFNVGVNAWKNNFNLINEIKQWMPEEQLLFLIAAGPFANILVHQLFAFNEKNSYLNIGSTLDNYLGLGKTRGYLNGANTLNKICIW
jgi:hypothetical protein